MVFAESSDESMQMRVLGFAKAIANLEMENGGGVKSAFAAIRSLQQADKTGTLEGNMLGQSRPIRVSAQEKAPPPEFPHVALRREVSIIGSTRDGPRPCILRALGVLSISPRVWIYCSSDICFR
jgi:hypothetical protein